MKITPTSLIGCYIIQPRLYEDTRGYFFESYNKNDFNNLLRHDVEFVQENQSRSERGVLRGLHYQLPPFSQAKLVRVLSGEVLDIAVDLRKESPTFGKYEACLLTAENKQQLFIPRGFAHGFITQSESAVFFYKCDNYYAPEHERGIRFDDPFLNIDWQIKGFQIKLSIKDQQLPLFHNIDNPF